MITQKDIAKSLGISQPAVGAVLGSFSENSKTTVSPELRDRILQRAKELGYRPNMFAQSMRGRSTGVIGAIHFTSFLQTTVQREIHMARAIAEQGRKLITADAIALAESATTDKPFRLLVDQMIDFRVDGVILSTIPGLMTQKEIARLVDAGIPCVSMSGNPFPGIPFVGADIEQGMGILTQHVIRQGYRHLAIITQEMSGDPKNPSMFSVNPRLKGYISAVENANGKVTFLNDLKDSKKGKRVSTTNGTGALTGAIFSSPGSMDLEETYAVGYRAVNRLLDFGYPADVILLPNDDWLQGALLALKERCVSVPVQIGLTGFDGSPFGQYGILPFTTVAQPLKEIAYTAVDLLCKMIEEKPVALDTVIRLPCSLVPGATTAPRKSL